jgi:nitrate reductase NapE component
MLSSSSATRILRERVRTGGSEESVTHEFMSFALFIVLSFVVYPILGRLRQAFARAMPRTASVDSQRFSSEWLEI